MKFTKSVSLSFLSLTLLMPMASVRAEQVPTTPPKAGIRIKEVAAQIRSSVAQSLKLENKTFKQVMADAQDAVVSSVKAHPYAALSAAIATAAITAYIVKRTLFGKRK